MKNKKNLAVVLGVASVWFGTHMGPGVASGNQVAAFYNIHSTYGLFTGIIAMSLLGLCIFYSIEYSRINKLYDFKSFANSFFKPHEKLFATFFEITYLATVAMVLGSCIATGAQALFQQFGLPHMLGTIILAAITILLTIFGADLVRSASTAMTIMILVSLSIVIYVALTSDHAHFMDNWNQVSTLPETLPRVANTSIFAAAWSAILYASFQSAGNIANAISVVEGLESRKDSIKATALGIFFNSLLIFGVVTLMYAYPDVMGHFFDPARVDKSFIPNLVIIQELGKPVLSYVYLICLILGIITTLVSFAFAVISRYSKFLPVKNTKVRDLSTVILMLIVCITVSTLGLDAIVKTGFKYLAYACIAVVIIPILAMGRKKIKESEEKNL